MLIFEEMGEQATFTLGIIVIITYFLIPMTESTSIDTYKNTISQLDGNDISGSHIDICCDAAYV